VPKPAIIVLASRIGAGKSTLAQALGLLSGYRVFSFGQYVKQIALTQNTSVNREALQDLGERLVANDPESFKQEAFSSIDFCAGIIIDGLRHKSVLEQIRLLANQVPLIVVFIRTDDRIRTDRLAARGMSLEEIERAENHIMERFLEQALLPLADIVVDGAASPDSNAEAILCRAANLI